MSDDGIIMPDPLAFFITWPTYGTWLPGDERGWVEYHRGWKLPNPSLEQACRKCMVEEQCVLSATEREIVIEQIRETCSYRKWTLLATACRSNHVHVVVGAVGTHPKKIRIDLKAWCTRRLQERSNKHRTNWWAERGSIRYVWDDESLAQVVAYVCEGQDHPGRYRT